MDYLNFKKLLAFFSALKDSGFRTTLEEIPNFTILNRQHTPINKAECLKLLRLLPDFQGENFQNDNNIIKYLSDPRNRDRILGKFSKEQNLELTKVLEEKPVIVEEGSLQNQEAMAGQEAQPAGTNASSGSIPFSAPTAPSFSTSPGVSRIIHEVPHAETPKSDIVVTKGGAVPEAPPSEFHVTDKSGNITATYSKESSGNLGAETAKPKLVVANSAGAVTEAGDASKLVVAGRGGLKEASPKQIFIANKEGLVTGMQNIKSPSWLKTFGSNAQIFASRNLRKVIDGLKGMAGGVGKGITGPGITGAYNLSSRLGSGAINAGLRLSHEASSVRTTAATTGKRAALAGVLGFLLLFVFISAFFPSGQTGEASGGPTPFPSTSPTQVAFLGCPTAGTVTAPYGYNIKDYPQVTNEGCGTLPACHSGIDIAGAANASVATPINGAVTEVGRNAERGPYLVISDSQTGYKVLIAHLDAQTIAAQAGATVKTGDIVGKVGNEGEGSSGYHIHYRLYKDGQIVNPFRYLGSSYTLGGSALIQSDDIAANDYKNGGDSNLGSCK